MVAERTGWTKREILRMSLSELQAMLADAPRLVSPKEKREFKNDAELIHFLKN
ncbi:MAG: hypothetical protein V6Z82_05925 [Flavobacteriales bacterium]